jgi:hypothetical protein
MTETEKLAMITEVVDKQISAQNDEDGDKYQSDASLAMEAIEEILTGSPDMGLGSMRTFFPEGARR